MELEEIKEVLQQMYISSCYEVPEMTTKPDLKNEVWLALKPGLAEIERLKKVAFDCSDYLIINSHGMGYWNTSVIYKKAYL